MNISDGMDVFFLEQKYFADSKRFSSVLIDYLYDRRFSFVCEKDSKIVGFIIAEENKEIITITTVCVIKEYSNQGIAKRLLNKCILEIQEIFRNKPIQLMVSQENVKAIKIYEKLGFKAVHKEKEAYFDNSDGIIMEYTN